MIPLRLPIRALLLVMAASAVRAQNAPDPAIPPTIVRRHKTPNANGKAARAALNPNVIVLDPGHGGADAGATLGDKLLEKDVTLAFAHHLRDLLGTQGFTVLLTHDAASDDTSTDQRAEVANRSHPLACLLLHAVNGGRGVHLFTSSLTPVSRSEDSQTAAAIVPWDTAQTPELPQAARLASQLVTAFNGARIPNVLARVSLRPMDSMTSPAIALELAPIVSGNGQIAASDSAYQQRVAEAVVSALVLWRGQAVAQAAATAAAPTAKSAPGSSAPANAKASENGIAAKPKTKTPAPAPSAPSPPHVQAPIVRQEPAARPAPSNPQDKGPRS